MLLIARPGKRSGMCTEEMIPHPFVAYIVPQLQSFKIQDIEAVKMKGSQHR